MSNNERKPPTELVKSDDEAINPKHYRNTSAKCSYCGEPIECIDVVEHMGFSLGNAVKYIWRVGQKPGESVLRDLKKAAWYIAHEIGKIEKAIERKGGS